MENEVFVREARKLAELFGIDETASENALRGAVERVETAIEKGEVLTKQLCELALLDYLQWLQKYLNDLETNNNGERDKLEMAIYEQLKQKASQ